MSITYKLRIDREYFRTTIDRYYRQKPFFLWLPVQYGILALLFVIAWFSLGQSSFKGGATILIASLLAGVAAIYLTKWLILKRLVAHAQIGEQYTIILSEGGLKANGNHVKSQWSWAAYPNSVRFSDGILLLRRGVMRWLPDSALEDGTPSEATSLVGAHTMLRHLSD